MPGCRVRVGGQETWLNIDQVAVGELDPRCQSARHTGGVRDWEWAQTAGMISKPEATDVTVAHSFVDVVHHNLIANDVSASLGLIHEFWSWIARDGAYGRLG